MKTHVLKVMQTAGAFAPFRFMHRDKALVLMYHRFSRGEHGPGLPARIFREQLEYLAAHYRIVPLSFLAAVLNAGRPVPPRTAVITIDDGYRDAFTVAFPLLRAHEMPATLFLVSGFTDGRVWLWTDKVRYLVRHAPEDALRRALDSTRTTQEPHAFARPPSLSAAVNARMKTLEDAAKDDAIAALAERVGVPLPEAAPAPFASVSWDEAREMSAAGIDIGSHTVSYPILTNVNGRRLRSELADSRGRLEDELGRRVDLFCYPNGTLNAGVRQAVRQAGYSCAVTSDAGFNDARSDLLALRRISTEGDLPRFVQSTSGFEHLKIRMFYKSRPAWQGG